MNERSVGDDVRDARARLALVGIDGPDAELLAAWAAGSGVGAIRVDMAMGRPFEPDALDRFRTGRMIDEKGQGAQPNLH